MDDFKEIFGRIARAAIVLFESGSKVASFNDRRTLLPFVEEPEAELWAALRSYCGEREISLDEDNLCSLSIWLVIAQHQTEEGQLSSPTIESGLIFSKQEAIRTMLYLRDKLCSAGEFEPNEGRATVEEGEDLCCTAVNSEGEGITWYVVQQETYGEHKPYKDLTPPRNKVKLPSTHEVEIDVVYCVPLFDFLEPLEKLNISISSFIASGPGGGNPCLCLRGSATDLEEYLVTYHGYTRNEARNAIKELPKS